MSNPWKCICGELNTPDSTGCCQCGRHTLKNKVMSKEQTKYFIEISGIKYKSIEILKGITDEGCHVAKFYTATMDEKDNQEKHAQICCDSLNIHLTTGLTPSQLQQENKGLNEQIELLKERNSKLASEQLSDMKEISQWKEQRNKLLKEVQMLSRNREKDFSKSFRNKAEVERHLMFVGEAAHKIYLEYSNKKD